MFNFLVAGNSVWWEGERLTIGVDRFKEYSGAEADAVALDQPETLKQLEEVPALLMYEVGARGPNARLVRHGRLQNIVRQGKELTFSFVPDPERAYLDQGVILAFSEQLGLHRWELTRTHWAIKDGELPAGILDTAVAERPVRTIGVIAAQYVEALQAGDEHRRDELEEELRELPASLEKALALLPSRLLDKPTPELYPSVGTKPRTPESRTAVAAVLARDGAEVPSTWPYSLAWFLDLYGSPTEAPLRDDAVYACSQHMIGLGREVDDPRPSVEAVAEVLWRCARSPLLAGRLRREIGVLIDQLERRQGTDGYWSEDSDAGETRPSVRGTAMATVVLQRLGDDRHHSRIQKATAWLIRQPRAEDGALPRHLGAAEPDVIATIFTMEAIRRSDVAGDLSHVLTAGDAWLLASQTELGGWVAEPWPDDFVVASVLDYLQRRGAMLPQVDGFLLMARDFLRKAEGMRLEGGANNRRLAAIATVHAVEMFLYGLFERRPDFALSAFKENGVETLGLREAMKALQERMQLLQLLAAPRRLSYRDQISSLVGKRDGIIHRAHEISEAELDIGMRHARQFIEQYGAELLNLDLLQ